MKTSNFVSTVCAFTHSSMSLTIFSITFHLDIFLYLYEYEHISLHQGQIMVGGSVHSSTHQYPDILMKHFLFHFLVLFLPVVSTMQIQSLSCCNLPLLFLSIHFSEFKLILCMRNIQLGNIPSWDGRRTAKYISLRKCHLLSTHINYVYDNFLP